LAPARTAANPERCERLELVDRAHPLRHRCVFVTLRAAAELSQRYEQQQDPEDDLDPADPGGWCAGLARVGRPGDREDDGADDAEAEQPPEQERWAVGLGPGGGEHQHDRDDRDGADRDPDRQRE
jgi:hypothetical protein